MNQRRFLASAVSKTQAFVFQSVLGVKAIEAERCSADGTQRAEDVDDLAVAVIEDGRSILHQHSEYTAPQ